MTVWWLKCVSGIWLALPGEDFHAWLDSVRSVTVAQLHGVVIAFRE